MKPKSIGGLDGLRAFCVLLVLIDHAGLTNQYETGTLAVWAFFALSGFLIVPILFKARLRVEAGSSDSLREFLLFARDRALRIFPVYYVALVIALVLGLNFASPDNVEKIQGSVGWLFTYTTNLYIGFVRESWLGPLSHLWTLAVEQQFYILFPLVFIFIPARHWMVALTVAMILMIAVPIVLFFDNELKFRVNSLSGFYAICIGGLFGLAVRSSPERWRIPFPATVLSGLALLLLVQHVGLTLAGHTNVSLLIAPLISGLLITLITVNQNNAAIRFLEIPLVRGVGVVSYGFYLFHGFLLGPSGRLVSMVTGLREGLAYQMLQIGCAFVVTMVVSIISFLYFEQKFMELKKRRAAPKLAVEPGGK